MMKPLKITTPLAAISVSLLLACGSSAQTAAFDIDWTGANGWSLEGQFRFPSSLLGTGPINETQIDSLSFDVLLNGVSQATYAGPVDVFNDVFNFDTTTEQFVVGGFQGSLAGQSWNDVFQGTGAGFASGLSTQSVLIDGVFQSDSSILTSNSTLTATRVVLTPLEYTAVLEQSDLFLNEFDTDDNADGTFSARSQVLYGTDDLPLFNADFSTDKTVVLRIEAPVGHQFIIDAPDTFSDERLLDFNVGTVADDPLDTGPMTGLVFENLTGAAPTLTGEFQDQDDGNGDFAMRITGTFDGPATFTALEATFQVPNDFDAVQIDNADVFAQLLGSLSGTSTGAPLTDPGLWLRIAPIPEPSSLALLGLGGLLVARRRPRTR